MTSRKGAVLSLVRRDARVVLRDAFLLPLVGYPLLLALGCRLLVAHIPIEHLDLFVAPALGIFGPLVVGSIFGFELIEEKEQRTEVLRRIVPVPPAFFATYTLIVSTICSVGVSTVALIFYGHGVSDPGGIACGIGVSALAAPLVALLLGRFASNKIEGLGIGKFLSAMSMAYLVVFFLPPGWQLICSWNPWYWLYVGMLPGFHPGESVAGVIGGWPGYSPGLALLVALALIGGGLVLLLFEDRRRQP